MRNASPKPRVIASASGSPSRSSSALVATVVPMRTSSTSPPSSPSTRPIASSAASSYWPGFSESSFSIRSRPSSARATTSVKVPPRSMAKVHDRFTPRSLGLSAFGSTPYGAPMIVLVTGAAGFIGAATTRALLARGDTVIGIDNLNDYYDPALKQARLRSLHDQGGDRFRFGPIDFADAE